MSKFIPTPPMQDETAADYAARLEADTCREIHLRKAMREHFGMTIDQVIPFCAVYPKARKREIEALRQRFPALSRNRFIWRIGQSMTLPKSEATYWADTILDEESEAKV